jgi:hypothetical protein
MNPQSDVSFAFESAKEAVASELDEHVLPNYFDIPHL